MARRRTGGAAITRAPNVVVVRNQGGSSRGRIARRVGGAVARGAGRAAAWAAREEKHTLTAVAAAAFMGAARRFGWKLPKLPGTSPALTAGLAAWAWGRFGKSNVAAHVGTGLLSVGIYDAIAYDKQTRDAIEDLLAEQRTRIDNEEDEDDDGGPARGRASTSGGL